MKPKSIRGAIQQMLPEIEEMLFIGVAREEIYKEVAKRYGFENIKIGSFDLALYRARVKAKANQSSSNDVLHNTESDSSSELVLQNTDGNEEIGKPEPKGILDKKFFDEVNAFDPKQFNTKYK